MANFDGVTKQLWTVVNSLALSMIFLINSSKIMNLMELVDKLAVCHFLPSVFGKKVTNVNLILFWIFHGWFKFDLHDEAKIWKKGIVLLACMHYHFTKQGCFNCTWTTDFWLNKRLYKTRVEVWLHYCPNKRWYVDV